MLVPNTLKVGFQERSDTYTGKLAYVTYIDQKNVLRKEKSWNGWINKTIPVLTLINEPKSGFVIGKDIKRYGGYSWSSGRNVIRVWHPDDFEFEITPSNLIMIMMHTDISRREIQGEMVLAWEGQELVLLPKDSDAYRNAEFCLKADSNTPTQMPKITLKSCEVGKKYISKKQEGLYLGTLERDRKEEKKEEQLDPRYYTNRFQKFVNIKKEIVPIFIDDSGKIITMGKTLQQKDEMSHEIPENWKNYFQEYQNKTKMTIVNLSKDYLQFKGKKRTLVYNTENTWRNFQSLFYIDFEEKENTLTYSIGTFRNEYTRYRKDRYETKTIEGTTVKNIFSQFQRIIQKNNFGYEFSPENISLFKEKITNIINTPESENIILKTEEDMYYYLISQKFKEPVITSKIFPTEHPDDPTLKITTVPLFET